MELVDFDLQNTILCGSSEEDPCDAEYCDEIGFNADSASNHKV